MWLFGATQVRGFHLYQFGRHGETRSNWKPKWSNRVFSVRRISHTFYLFIYLFFLDEKEEMLQAGSEGCAAAYAAGLPLAQINPKNDKKEMIKKKKKRKQQRTRLMLPLVNVQPKVLNRQARLHHRWSRPR